MGVALQLAMVAAGHFLAAILNLSGILGTAIPFFLAIPFGATTARSWKEASWGGFVVGVVGAVVGVVAAIVMGDQTWMLLTFAPIAVGICGTLGAAVGRLARAKG
jgi:hypothetical protein